MRQKTHDRRAGFTLIELMMVMGVTALLITVLVGASFRFVVSARETATRTTINKVSGIIQDRVRAYKDFDFTDAAIAYCNSYNLNNSSDVIMTPALAEVLVRKVRYKKAFPQSYSELDSNQIARFFPSYTSTPPGYPVMSATLPLYDSKYEPGIVLYAMLMNGETFGVATPEVDTFTGAEIKNTPQTGNLPCLVDSWGEPLRFYRWPTRLIRCGEADFNNSGSFNDLNQNGNQDAPGWVDGTGMTFSPAIRPNTNFPSGTPASLLISNLPIFNPPPTGTTPPASFYAWGPDQWPGSQGASAPFNSVGFPDTDDPEPLNVDPDDPSFQLSLWLFLDSNLTAAQLVTRRTTFTSTFHDFYTFQTPLVVSAGPDKQLGLYEPTNTANFGYLAAPLLTPTPYQSLQYLYDNITNLNQRVGGK